ncbi:hypothetical protein A4X09_0g2844 [Tilletia walkeri]|uniref:Elongation factor 2 n=1 Tax=Tilletia walkeri TaxID=117179 RepID=A0A8X7T5B3_9BASI|nr:hypothetical protein A4X09_0g2844 [Tilletia walkeri]
MSRSVKASVYIANRASSLSLRIGTGYLLPSSSSSAQYRSLLAKKNDFRSISIQKRVVKPLVLPKYKASSTPVQSFSTSTRTSVPADGLSAPYLPDLIRNISIIAHIDAGKTTLTERLLLYSQHQQAALSSSTSARKDPASSAGDRYSSHISLPGSVDTGTTVTDFLDAERERGITIQSAAVGPLYWSTSPASPPATSKNSSVDSSTAIYLVDTPGHIDFTIEVERALRVVDGCVVVLDGVEGVEAQTEGVWRQAARYGIRSHIVFINKLDRAGASVPRSLLSLIQRNLHSRPVLLQLPVYTNSQGDDESLTGLIDLLDLDLLSFTGNAGESIQREPLSPSHPLFHEALKARSSLIETLAEQDEDLLEQYLEVSDILEEASSSTNDPTEEQRQRHVGAIWTETHLRPALRRQTIRGSVIPVLCGAAAKNLGVQPLLDAVAWYLPSPIEAPVAANITTPELAEDDAGTKSRPGAKGKAVKHKELDPHERELAALAFKVVWDKRKGPITFVRVYSGTLSRSSTLFNTTTQARERLSKVFLPFADQYVETPSLRAGQIGVLMGLRDTRTGDTLIDPRSVGPTSSSNTNAKQLRLRPIHVPPPVFSMSIEPESKSDEASVNEALSMLVRTDPSLRLDEGGSGSSGSASGGSFGAAGTGQTVLSGMGELHLEIARERLANEFGVRARMGSVRVSYRETLDQDVGEVEVEEMWEKELGGKKMKVGCMLSVRRLREEDGEVGDPNTGGNVVLVQLDEDELDLDVGTDTRSSDKDDDSTSLDPETVRQAFTTGLTAALSRGPLSSNPLTNLHLTLSNPVLFGPELSPPRALSMAAGAALRSVIRSSAPSSGNNGGSTPSTAARMMEPVMRVRIECDAAHMGKVVGDLTADQAGTVVDVEQQGQNDESESTTKDSTTAINVYIPPDDLSSSSSSSGSSGGGKMSGSSVRTRTIVHALVPLARLVSYSSRLRALTGGMGTFTMELHGFAQTSREREREILRELGKAV